MQCIKMSSTKTLYILADFMSVTVLMCRSQWPRRPRCGSAAARLRRIPPRAWMFASSTCCVLAGKCLCFELITRTEEYYRVCLSLRVICKPQEWGGHGPSWAAAPQEKKILTRDSKFAYVWAVCKQYLNTGKSFRTQMTSLNISEILRNKESISYDRVMRFTAENISSKKQIKLWCAIHECAVIQDTLKSFVKAKVSRSQFIKATSVNRDVTD